MTHDSRQVTGDTLNVTFAWVREAIKKSVFLSDIVQKGGGVQPESKSFEVVLFSLILTFFWTINGGRVGGGMTMF